MQPLSGNHRPDLLTSLMNMSLVITAPATENASVQILFKCPMPASAFETACSFLTRCTIPSACHAKRHLNVQKCSECEVLCAFWLWNVLRATTACTLSTCQLPKVVRHWGGLRIFDLEMCFAPQRRALFRYRIATSKSAPNVRCVVHFDLEMFFAPENGVHFFDIATSKSARNMRSVFYFLTWKCASRHNGVQFFISHLARWLRARRFSEPTFRPGATNHWKNTVNRDFSTFSRACIFFWFFFFSDRLSSSLLFSYLLFSSLLWLFPPLLFHLSILSEVWFLNFFLI